MTLRKSWVPGANDPAGDFPLNNLALGVFSVAGEDPRCGVAIGDMVLDVAGMERAGWLRLADDPVMDLPYWNEVMELGQKAWARMRTILTGYLAEGAETRAEVEPFLHPRTGVTLHMPMLVAEYTDFYASRHHAFNVGSMFRDPANALPPNWLHIPIGYNGRASSVVVSGTPVRRPWGQLKGPQDAAPRLAPSARFDFELELGAIVGRASDRPVTVAEADEMIFGYVLLNDWSARDIQAWEYQPLGPFQAKATATTISPWIVMRAALSGFRVPTPEREVPLLPYLAEPGPLGQDIDLSVALRPDGGTETVIAQTNARELYYAAAQQLAHHTLCGCPMTVGDLLGSGTISGPTAGSRGSLLELSWGGKEPLAIAGGSRSFLEDGDTLILRGHAQGDGFRIGFGECAGRVVPALAGPYALP
ncbi:MAG: fumarylacetoacetase [Paracoccaceae bacterium]|nr:MAG: fumarylacetoacetase [Paracoccaceae bacterium]